MPAAGHLLFHRIASPRHFLYFVEIQILITHHVAAVGKKEPGQRLHPEAGKGCFPIFLDGAGGKGGSLSILGCQDEKKRKKMINEIDSSGKGIRSLPFVLAVSGLTVQARTVG